jgi:hypothetical protein
VDLLQEQGVLTDSALHPFLQGRRRRMLVEQQAARSAAEGRVEADCLLEVLVRRSAEEQKLAQHLWQLQQEKVRAYHNHTTACPCSGFCQPM